MNKIVQLITGHDSFQIHPNATFFSYPTIQHFTKMDSDFG